jgi:phage shock protein A
MQQNKLVQLVRKYVARLKQEGTAFQAEIADRRQRSPTLQKQAQAAELVKVNRAGLAPRLDNFSNNVLQAAGQSIAKCLLKRIAFVVEWWKTLNESANAAQQRVAELATLTEALQAEILLR